MIIQRIDRKKLYINIAVLGVVFSLTLYLIFSNISFSSSGEKNSVVIDSAVSQTIKFKYDGIRKIDLTILDDSRYRELQAIKSGFHPKLEKGNPEPFGEK